MNQNANRRVFVALPSGSAVTEIDTLQLLSEAEVDLSSVQFIGSDVDIAKITSVDALVVVLTDGQTTDATVAAATLAAARVGLCNIVGVWAPGQSETGIHPSVLMFGTAQIPWDSGQLKQELGSDCANSFQTSEGKAADANEIDPNECE